jgi:pyruvate dehydrogenase E2 component (dihydrolipoamide acetyltransferase)
VTAPVPAVDVTMPQLGETVSEGSVTRWLKQVGDSIADQEPLLEIATDKVDTEISAPTAGVLLEILVAEDEIVPAGTLLARIGTPAGAVQHPDRTAAPVAAVMPRPEPTSPSVRHQFSPRLRKLAHDSGVDLDVVTGTGRAGRLRDEDVYRASRCPTRRDESSAVHAVAPARSATSDCVAVIEIDVTQVATATPDPMTMLAALVGMACVAAARLHPTLSGDRPGVPDLEIGGQTIPNAGDLSVQALLRRVATSAAGSTVGHEPSLAVYSAGRSGPLLQTVPLASRHVAALTIGTIVVRPVVVADAAGRSTIGVRSMAYLTLVYKGERTTAQTASDYLHAVRTRVEDWTPDLSD